MPPNIDITAIGPVYDENGNRVPSRWDLIVAERKRKAERETRKADRRAGVKRAPNQFETVLGTAIGVLILLGILIMFGAGIHAVFGSYPN